MENGNQKEFHVVKVIKMSDNNDGTFDLVVHSKGIMTELKSVDGCHICSMQTPN
jgi:hypothetical protein